MYFRLMFTEWGIRTQPYTAFSPFLPITCFFSPPPSPSAPLPLYLLSFLLSLSFPPLPCLSPALHLPTTLGLPSDEKYIVYLSPSFTLLRLPSLPKLPFLPPLPSLPPFLSFSSSYPPPTTFPCSHSSPQTVLPATTTHPRTYASLPPLPIHERTPPCHHYPSTNVRLPATTTHPRTYGCGNIFSVVTYIERPLFVV